MMTLRAMRANQMRAAAARMGLGLLWALALVGCAAEPASAPAEAIAADSGQSAASRRTAMVRLLREARAAPEADRAGKVADARESLKRIAWRRSVAAGARLGAIAALADDDPEDTARMVALLLPTETAWPVIEGVSQLAVERGWTGLTTALTRSWSRKVVEPADEARPERAALEALHPNTPVKEVVFNVFLQPQGAEGFAARARSDAWGLLMRLDAGGEWTAQQVAALGEQWSSDPFIADIQQAADDLGAIPLTSEQVDWLRTMRKPDHAAQWQAAASAVKELSPAQRTGLALRHAPILAWASAHRPAWLSRSREELLADVESRLATRKIVRRTAGYPDAHGAPRETIKAWRNDLSWGDALALRTALEAADALAGAGELVEQAETDRADRSTEHGGLIEWTTADGFIARPYPPRPSQRYGDNRFVASSDMLEAGAWALFHYHFHAQRAMNDEHAGPGAGDLEYADRQGCACLVFTSVGERALDADYYQPGGARIDLGVIRPSGG